MKTIILSAAVAVAMLGAGFPASSAQAADPVCGDVNDTSSVNATDALLVLRKGVGQPVVLDCKGYDDAINSCELDLMEASGDLLSCQGALANAVGELEQCTSEASCGNGEVDAVGEQCDGDDLYGNDCRDLGYDAGTLDCHESCKFDPLRCFDCASYGGTVVDRYCWYLGPAGDNCDEVCADAGLVYDSATWDFAGSGAPDASGCVAVSNKLAPAVAPFSPLDMACGGGFSGCTIDITTDRYARCLSPPTTSTAANAKQRRFCACKPLILIF